MGRHSSHTRALLSSFIIVDSRSGIFGREGGEDTFDGTLDSGVWLESVGHIDKGNVYTGLGRERIAGAVEPVGFAHAAAHCHPVDGMAQSFLGHGYEESGGRIGAAGAVGTRHCTKGIDQSAEFGSAGTEEYLYGADGTELVFFTETEFFHNQAFAAPLVRAR